MDTFFRTLTFSKVITYLQIISLWLLVAAIPFPMGGVPRFIMIIAGVLFLLEYVVNRRWKTWHWNRNKWLYIAMIVYYLLIPIWHIFSKTESPIYHIVLERRMAFMLCGIIGLLGFNRYVKLSHLCTIFLLTAIGTSLYIIFAGDGLAFFVYDWGRQSFVFTQTRIALLNNHMIYNMYLNISLIAAFYLINTLLRKPKQLMLVILGAIWIFYILCLTEGRVGLLTSLLLVASFIIIMAGKYNWKILPIPLIVFIGICWWVITQNQRLEVDAIAHDPREMIWEAGWQNTQVAPILGQGVSDAKESFITIAQSNKELLNFWAPYVQNIRNGHWYYVHPHNAFLETWAEFGIIGLATLLFLFIYPLTMLPKKHRIYFCMIAGCVGMQCLFDFFLVPILYCLAIIFFAETTTKPISNKEKVASPTTE